MKKEWTVLPAIFVTLGENGERIYKCETEMSEEEFKARTKAMNERAMKAAGYIRVEE